ncbi:MAG: YlmC/YmxH family sporulation protein [Clostridia bacterium]|nr:YlmC/YmxH family sporulation protein [Clostridia bacterium]
MNGTRITDLSSKEVINLCDGARLGYVTDIEIDSSCGRVISIIVPGSCGWKFWQRQVHIIPWESIQTIGDDIILVDYKVRHCHCNDKKTWFS